MGAAVYAAAAEQGEAHAERGTRDDVPGAEAHAEGGTRTDGGQEPTDAGDDDVVDAEVVEDDEEKK